MDAPNCNGSRKKPRTEGSAGTRNRNVKTVELMLGKLIPYVIIGLIQMGIILWLGWLLFQVPVAGSWLLLIASCLIFIFANLGLGLVLSTIAPNQMGAMQLFIFIFLPYHLIKL